MPDNPKVSPKGRPTPKRPAKARTAPPSGVPVPAAIPIVDHGQAATDASEWKSTRRNGFPVMLPSGNVARLRRTFNMLNMLEGGDIPNPLGAIIREAIESATDGAGAIAPNDFDQNSEAGRQAMVQFLDMLMRSMTDIFVQPRVLQVPDGEDAATWEPGYRGGELTHPDELGCISVIDLDATDQMYAFSFAQGGAGSMANFRPEPVETVQLAQDGDGVQGPAL